MDNPLKELEALTVKIEEAADVQETLRLLAEFTIKADVIPENIKNRQEWDFYCGLRRRYEKVYLLILLFDPSIDIDIIGVRQVLADIEATKIMDIHELGTWPKSHRRRIDGYCFNSIRRSPSKDSKR